MKYKIVLWITLIICILAISWPGFFYSWNEVHEFVINMKSVYGWKALILGGIVYALLLSIPFFPGIELGFILMLLFGKEGIFFIYLCTLSGLSLSFLIGRQFKNSVLTSWLNIEKLQLDFSHRFNVTNEKRQQNHHRNSLISHLRTFVKSHPSVTLAVLINTPGNSFIGGGGGISFVSGVNHAFSWRGFIVSIIIATMPVPALLFLGIIKAEILLSYLK